METQNGKTVPMVKEFQVESSWVPVTPLKPHLGQIYKNNNNNIDIEDYMMSRYSHQNDPPQTLLSYSITSAEGIQLIPSSSNNNDFWDGRMNNVEMERRGLEDYLPGWSSQGRRTKVTYPSSYPTMPMPPPPPLPPAQSTYPSSLQHWRNNNNNGVRDIGHHSFNQFDNLSFADLLAMKDNGMGNAAYLSGSDSNPTNNATFYGIGTNSMFSNQNHMHRFHHQFRDIFGGEMLNCASHHYQSVCDANSPSTTKHPNGKNSTFAPATPDSRWRIDSSNVVSGNTTLGTYQGPNEQNRLHEQDAAAAMVNLQNVHGEIAVPNTDSSPGKVSAVENHNPDKGVDQIIDLNKTPQKKPRRRRYQPKVLSEKKPKRTPKPKTPKPNDSSDARQVKRKYVRKSKADTPSTTPAGATEAGEANPTAGEPESTGATEPGEPESTGDPESTEATETGDTKPTGTAVKSCKRSLNFDLNGQAAECCYEDLYAEPQPNRSRTAGNQESQTVHLRQEEASMVGTSRVGIAYDLNYTQNQELLHYLSLPTKESVDNSQADLPMLSNRNEKALHDMPGNNAEVPSRNDAQSAQSPSSSPCASSNEQGQTRGSKRSNPCIPGIHAGSVAAAHCTFYHPNHTLRGNANDEELHKFLFPEICKKKRTEKVQRPYISGTSSTAAQDVKQVSGTQNHPRVDPTTSNYYVCNPVPFRDSEETNNHAKALMGSIENRMQFLNTWADMARLKKKRSKATTRVRDLDQLMEIASSFPVKPGPKGPRKKINTSEHAHLYNPNSELSHREAVVTDSTDKPRSKRRSKKQNSLNQQMQLILYHPHQSTKNARGSVPALPWARTGPSSVEEVTELMKQLNINTEGRGTPRQSRNALVPYRAKKQKQNALVVYGRDGTMVPFDGPFDPIRKRRQRAKVDLDDETTRVWKLLLENIDNKGIDGTDEDKAQWWEDERSVFRGRVDSFIARMRLVQGDRRFTPWKGSVLDSVIGVFLTQNVSDHLSSSAFMSLAARFPLKSEGSESTLSEESTTALVVEPEVCIVEPEESITWNEKTIDQQTMRRNSRIMHDIDHSEEKEVVNSKELTGRAPGSISPKDSSSESSQKAPNSSIVDNANSQTAETANILGDDRAKDDASSSQHSVMSSQNSTNSPNLHTVGTMNIFSESDSRTQPLTTNSQSNYFDCSTSFMGLLKMAESPFLHEAYSRTQHDPLDCMNHVRKSSPEAQGVCSSDNLLNLNFQLSDAKGIEMLEVESRSADTSRKDENSTPTEQSNIITESTVQDLAQEKSSDSIPGSFAENMRSFYVLEGEKMVMQSQKESAKEPSDAVFTKSTMWKSTNLSQVTADVTESTAELKRTGNDHKQVEQISMQAYASGGVFGMMDANASKSRKGKPGRAKNDTFDWDSLRREAQANGIKRERTADTRDSLDWEAVRHAHVSEIAETIKERGMNNMLAERIKDLLDRLVKEHGSINMEWLRDIPPDKAKEYLLSFRGLGLKSVECVRLLTLHHMAFPVDTNVGRIAVRLGWVPLQPLPESLQLHLLELYPILESIQKYLWPRLCKLDQKTLYELHYHLITFGKVFCTKRQPNCNACPLRGECRHFASAFASARFALPGPEERSIMPSSGCSAHPIPQTNINLLPLPPSWSKQHSHSNSNCINESPIQYPPLALPSPETNTINHLERRFENTYCEPIVEVPASPEPEPEQEQTLCDIEDTFYEDPDEIPTIKLNMKEFTQTLQNFMQANKELQEVGVSNALVALTPEAASIPTPKLKNISRLRTEHHVYELPDTHPLLKGLDKREPDDPCSYLLAIWTPGETANSIEPPERKCHSEDPNILCNDETCSYCNSQREANSQIVRGTLLIPCRTAMRGSFPLNGTYFQVNEVFADHDSSLDPIAVPRSWLWNLPRRTVYFGTSIPTIFRGLNTEDIQHCFWRGFVCVRGFDQNRRAPRPLMARLHFPASKMPRGTRGKAYDE